jgi:hypothetical protein
VLELRIVYVNGERRSAPYPSREAAKEATKAQSEHIVTEWLTAEGIDPETQLSAEAISPKRVIPETNKREVKIKPQKKRVSHNHFSKNSIIVCV